MTNTYRAPWFQRQHERWDEEEQAVKRRFPHFRWEERPYPHLHRLWRGELHPLYPGCPVGLVAAHLKNELPLMINSRGALLTSSLKSEPLAIASADELYVPYMIEVVYHEPPIPPSIHILHPRVDLRVYPEHPHLYALPRPLGRSNAAACVYAPHDGDWSWNTSTAAKLIEWTALWIANHILWVQTDKWFGPQSPHTRAELYGSVHPSAPCHCGSRKLYGQCHRPRDKNVRLGVLAQP